MKRTMGRGALKLWILFFLLLFAVFVSLLIGRLRISAAECIGILFSGIFPVGPRLSTVESNIVLLVRVPRVLIAMLCGMSLSVAGTCYQCIFKNPLAAPDILGASTGAAFGAALAILMGLSDTAVTVCAFSSSLLSVGLVLLVGRLCPEKGILVLVLSGIMISSLFSAATSYLKLIADPHDTLPAITYWMMGSVSGASVKELSYIWIPMALAAIPVFALRWQINLLTLDDEEADAMGVHTGFLRILVIIAATLLTAASVAVSGIIGFVGLVVPHIARKLVGQDTRILIPASALLGGIFLILTDDLARNLYTTEIPLGVLTAFIGAPFFLWLLAGRRDT